MIRRGMTTRVAAGRVVIWGIVEVMLTDVDGTVHGHGHAWRSEAGVGVVYSPSSVQAACIYAADEYDTLRWWRDRNDVLLLAWRRVLLLAQRLQQVQQEELEHACMEWVLVSRSEWLGKY